jgi:hypothetical protein
MSYQHQKQGNTIVAVVVTAVVMAVWVVYRVFVAGN